MTAAHYDGAVRAVERGYYGSKVREPGEVFAFSGVLGSWMEPVEGDAPADERGPRMGSKAWYRDAIIAATRDWPEPVDLPADMSLSAMKELHTEVTHGLASG